MSSAVFTTYLRRSLVPSTSSLGLSPLTDAQASGQEVADWLGDWTPSPA